MFWEVAKSSWFVHSPATLTVCEVSPDFRELGILTGYRHQNQPWAYYLQSLFRIHNETFNVWTHLGGSVIFVAVLLLYIKEFQALDPGDNKVVILACMFGVCCLITNLTSSVVHLIHSKSCFVHFVSVLTDYIGVSIYPFGTAVMQMHISADKQVYQRLEGVFVYMNVFLAWLSFMGMSFAKVRFNQPAVKFQRKVLQAGAAGLYTALLAAALLPRYISCYYSETCSLSSLNHISVYLILLVVKAVLFATLIPERFWPGRFDIVGHSHQLFHVIATITQMLQLRAVHTDIISGQVHDGLAYSVSNPNYVALAFSLVVLLILDAVTLSLISKTVDIRHRKLE